MVLHTGQACLEHCLQTSIICFKHHDLPLERLGCILKRLGPSNLIRKASSHTETWGGNTLGLGETTLATQALTRLKITPPRASACSTASAFDRLQLVPPEGISLFNNLSSWRSHCLPTVRSRQPTLSPKHEGPTKPTNHRRCFVCCLVFTAHQVCEPQSQLSNQNDSGCTLVGDTLMLDGNFSFDKSVPCT